MSNAGRWCNTMVTELEVSVGARTAAVMLQACGRDCARASGIISRLGSDANICSADDLYSALNRVIPDLVQPGREEFYVSYPRCFCDLVAERLTQTPHLHCECSVWWIKEICAAITTIPVEVELLKSVIRGGDTCLFRVRVDIPHGQEKSRHG